MEELMKWIYSKLSIYGDVFFEDLERDKHGEAVIDSLKIVYSMPNIMQSSINKTREDIPLIIDILGKNEQVLEIENIIEQINSGINEEVYRSNTLFFIVQKQNNWILKIDDEDKNIRRKRLNYNIRFYK